MSPDPLRRAWTTVLRAAPARPSGRVVVCPHAGAGPRALQPLADRLPVGFEVVGIVLPGREHRVTEALLPTPCDPGTVVRAVLADLGGLPELPTVLFGHSMGAALAAALVTARPDRFAGAVLSAPPAPATPARLAGRWTDAELLEILRAGGRTPDALVDELSWRRHLLTVLRSDLTLGLRLAAGLDLAALPVPVTVLGGTHDLVAGHRATARLLPGGHFYLLEAANAAAVAGDIAAVLDSGRRRAA